MRDQENRLLFLLRVTKLNYKDEGPGKQTTISTTRDRLQCLIYRIYPAHSSCTGKSKRTKPNLTNQTGQTKPTKQNKTKTKTNKNKPNKQKQKQKQKQWVLTQLKST